jgi:hypothetical protein
VVEVVIEMSEQARRRQGQGAGPQAGADDLVE